MNDSCLFVTPTGVESGTIVGMHKHIMNRSYDVQVGGTTYYYVRKYLVMGQHQTTKADVRYQRLYG
jgi:hypothetical protein